MNDPEIIRWLNSDEGLEWSLKHHAQRLWFLDLKDDTTPGTYGWYWVWVDTTGEWWEAYAA